MKSVGLVFFGGVKMRLPGVHIFNVGRGDEMYHLRYLLLDGSAHTHSRVRTQTTPPLY